MESAHQPTCTPFLRCGCRYIPVRSMCRFAVDASRHDTTVQKDIWRRKYQPGSTCRHFPSSPPLEVTSGSHLTRTAQGNQSRHQLSSSGGCDSWGPQRRTFFAYQYLSLLERTHQTNILISSDGTACLADFGLTDFIETLGQNSASHYQGSTRWLAPELIHPDDFALEKFQKTRATDIYAFAYVCLEVCIMINSA